MRLWARLMTISNGMLALVATAAIGLGAGQAKAQVAPYAMFTAGHYSGLGVGSGTAANQSGGMTALGGTFGISDSPLHAGPISLGGDARAIIENSSNSTPYGNKIDGFLTGARLAVNTLATPLRPYVQAEIGVVGQNNGTSSSKSTSFAYQFQFGGDWTLIPHLAARFEYGAGQVETSGNNHTLQSFGAGLVLRL